MEQRQHHAGEPTVFHVTHWKAGSQWVKGVLADAQPNRLVKLKSGISKITNESIVGGGLYSPLYMEHPSFERAVKLAVDKRVFVVLRDLRDTLISWYFSLKVSHVPNEKITRSRHHLSELDIEEGLKLLIYEKLVHAARIQRTWVASDTPIFRYEELLADELGTFKKIFAYCEIDVPESTLEALVEKHSFERKAGRKPGEEDIQSHYRKAVVGDWKNYFTEPIKTLFKEKFGLVLINTGYEHSFAW